MAKLTEDELKKFDTLTEAYNKLIECQTALGQASEQAKHDFKTPHDIEKGYYFSNPIDIDYELKSLINKVKASITDFIDGYMDDKFNNLVIDSADVKEYFGLNSRGCNNLEKPVFQGFFTARAVIQYIEEKYADEETITLMQIKEYARYALPRIGEYTTEKPSKPEHILIIGKTGIELICSSYYSGGKEDPTAAVIKLIHIKLNRVLPSQAEHHNINYSDTYSDDIIKSLRKYKNGKLKIIFHKQGDMEIMRRTLVGCDE